MMICGRCHDRFECPAGAHELLYWADCMLCAREGQVVDCLPGIAKPVRRCDDNVLEWLRGIYLHAGQLEYRRAVQ